MDNITRINPHHNPKIEVMKDIKLPIELRNNRGEVIASVQFWPDFRKGYHAFVNDVHIDEYGHEELTSCLESTFAYLYSKMNDFRKIAEKHDRLVSALKESLSTPFNKL